MILALAVPFSSAAFAAGNTEPIHTAETSLSTSYEKDIADALSLGIIDAAENIGSENISREAFCEYVYNMINSIKELPTAKLARAPFDDVLNYKINALAFSKIVSGKEEHVFAPNDKITREEAAVILYRTAEYADINIPLAKVDITYSDNSEISDWAVSDIYSLRILGIIDGSAEKFEPQAYVTSEQAVSSIVKLHNIIKGN